MALKISEDERRRRSERAKLMHSERHPDDPNRRRFGGPQPGSGPKRQKRASELAAERIARHGNLMADVIIGAMRNEDPRIRLQGVKLAMDVEHREAELKMQEDRADEERSDGDLRRMLLEAAMNAAKNGVLDHLQQQDDQKYDAEAIAVELPE